LIVSVIGLLFKLFVIAFKFPHVASGQLVWFSGWVTMKLMFLLMKRVFRDILKKKFTFEVTMVEVGNLYVCLGITYYFDNVISRLLLGLRPSACHPLSLLVPGTSSQLR